MNKAPFPGVTGVLSLLPLLFSGCLTSALGGAWSHRPDEMEAGLSRGASDLVAAAFRDVDPARLVDYHTHVAGLGTGGTGAYVNPRMRSWFPPARAFTFAVYLSASGVEHEESADQEYVARLVDLVRHIPRHGRYCLLAMDAFHHPDGRRDLDRTGMFVPNEYVFDLARQHPDLFLPAMSIHPYRRDAMAELEKWAGQGGRIVKWLPNAMGINSADPACDGFYRKMRELGLILLCHAGDEQAVAAEGGQDLGNPLFLRRPLDAGVRVIAAHCAGLGESEDIEAAGRPKVRNFDLFLRLMGEKRYEGLLFGDISAMTQANRVGPALAAILRRTDLHPRLVNGSDYPLPAINIVIRTRILAYEGYITWADRELLNEIYDYNPLLFDHVLKRTIRAPGSGERFAPQVFMENPVLAVTGQRL